MEPRFAVVSPRPRYRLGSTCVETGDERENLGHSLPTCQWVVIDLTIPIGCYFPPDSMVQAGSKTPARRAGGSR
jgi:hypothetical protein